MKASALLRIPCWLWLPLVACGILLAWSSPSLLIAKKVAALLLLPTGVVWLGLFALAGWRGLGLWKRCGAIALLVVYTLAGNAWFGSWLLGRLEAPYLANGIPIGKLDAICVLGGGTMARPNGNAQLGPSGDRVMTAARLFLTGKTGHLVASGLNVTDAGGSRSLAEDTALIWRDLGIPGEAITLLSDPRTTKEEIRAYRKLMETRNWKHVGVCSSAWHLRRIERICKAEGLNMTPVPADFLSVKLPWSAMYAVPQARGFQNVQKALWEYLGGLVGG